MEATFENKELDLDASHEVEAKNIVEEDEIAYKIFYEKKEIKEVKKKQKVNVFKDIESAHQEVQNDLTFFDINPNPEKIYQKVRQNKINIIDFAPRELIEEDREKQQEEINKKQLHKRKTIALIDNFDSDSENEVSVKEVPKRKPAKTKEEK
jgi:hypothetical protein